MNVFALEFHPASTRGGQELSLFDELCALAGRGHDITLGYGREGDLVERYRQAGVRTLRIADIEIRPGRRARSTVETAASVVRAARTSPDVVCVNQYHNTFFGAGVAALARAPLVCHLRLTAPESLCSQYRIGLPRVTRFIAASQAIAESWIAERGVDRDTVDVAHDGIDFEHFRPRDTRELTRASLGLADDAFVVLSVGRIVRQKNLETLLAAFAQLPIPDAQLLVAGQPIGDATAAGGAAYLRALQELAAQLGVADRVHWLGARTDVPDLLAAADVSTLFAFREPLGRVTIEALACGRPIVASAGGGTDEILTGEFARWRIDPRDATAAAAALAALRGWQERDPRLAARAREHAVSHFSVSAKADAVERTFARARGERGAHGPRGALLRRVYPASDVA